MQDADNQRVVGVRTQAVTIHILFAKCRKTNKKPAI
jgi:hypothetical protein